MKNTNNPLCCWDGTLKFEIMSLTELHSKLKSVCKDGVFQGEIGDKTGYKHWQIRISLINKLRKNGLVNMMNNLHNGFNECHWTPTCTKNLQNYDYVTKERSKFIEAVSLKSSLYIPRQVREIKELRPFQKSIIEKLGNWDSRYINYIYQPKGNVGKSLLISYLRSYRLAKCLPAILKEGKDIMRMVMNMPTSKAYFVDMPRAMKKDSLFGFYSAIEEIKNGYAWDDRYKFREKIFDCPQVWIMSNSLPMLDWLSRDRWKFWTIDNKTFELKKVETIEIELLSKGIGTL